MKSFWFILSHLLRENVGTGDLLLHLYCHDLGSLNQQINISLDLVQLVETILQAVHGLLQFGWNEERDIVMKVESGMTGPV